jgi:hypothetical protein
MPLRDCRLLDDQLRDAILRGRIEQLAAALVEVAVASAVVSNCLETLPRTRIVPDCYGIELDRALTRLVLALHVVPLAAESAKDPPTESRKRAASRTATL